MILKLLFNLVIGLINLIPFELPYFPDGITTVLDTMETYLLSGVGLLKAFTDWSYLITLFKLVITMELVFYGYKLVLWILKKIPMLGIE